MKQSPTPRRRTLQPRLAHLSLALLVLGVLGACNDSSPTGARTRLGSRSLSHDDSVRATFFSRRPAGRSHAATFDAVNDGSISVVSVTPSTFQGFAQPLTIVITLSGPVGSVTVVGNGAIECAGDYGTLVGFDADGTQLGQMSLELIDPTDCSPTDNPDGVTFGAQGTLTVTNGILARVEIRPMSPLEFPVFDLTGHASATYSISIGTAATLQVTCDPASPVRGTAVLCSAKMSDGSTFTITHLKSSSSGSTIIDGDVSSPAPAVTFEWRGRAAVATDVEMSGTSAGKDIRGTSSFVITSRIGVDPQWIEPEFPNFPETPPATSFVTGRPLTAPYPGIRVIPDGYAADQGALGFTFFEYPTKAKAALIGSGPNQGVRYISTSPWEVDPRSGAPAAGVYVEQSLLASDPFYQRQVGPSPFCTQADMGQLSSLILRHENLHWTTARVGAKPLKTQTTIEAITELPGTTVLGAAYQSAQLAFAGAVSAANDLVEGTLLPVKPPNIPVCAMRP